MAYFYLCLYKSVATNMYLGVTIIYSLDKEELYKVVCILKYLDGGRIALGVVFLDLQHI